MDPNTGALDVMHFTSFLALLTGLAYIFGFIFLRYVPSNSEVANNVESQAISALQDERTPLLAAPRPPATGRPADLTVSELVRNTDFWLLAIYCVLILGVVSEIYLGSQLYYLNLFLYSLR